jgi:hypothetical protein
MIIEEQPIQDLSMAKRSRSVPKERPTETSPIVSTGSSTSLYDSYAKRTKSIEMIDDQEVINSRKAMKDITSTHNSYGKY